MLVSTIAYLHLTEQRCSVCINSAFADIPSICRHGEEMILQDNICQAADSACCWGPKVPAFQAYFNENPSPLFNLLHGK